MYDVAGRLADGLTSVEAFAHYTQACAALGGAGAGEEVHRAYGTEDGLDLHALAADQSALAAAADMVHDALALQDGQAGALDAAWGGGAAGASAEVLARHADASTRAAAALGTAATEFAALRDELWRLVDARAAAAQDVDARTDGVRDEWLSAAQTVTTGVGDQATASELVDQQVQPFVATDIRGEFLAAMESVTERIIRRFDAAIAAIGGAQDDAVARFAEPGALGQSWDAMGSTPSGVSADPGASAPAAPAAAVAPPAAPPLPPPATDPAAAVPAAPSGAGGGGLPGVGSGFSGLGQMVSDLLGGLLPGGGSGEGGLDDLQPDDPLDDSDDLDLDDDDSDDDDLDDEDLDDNLDDEDEEHDEENADDAVDVPGDEDDPAPESAAPPPGAPPVAADVPEPPAPTPAPSDPSAPVADPVPPPASGTAPDAATTSATPCEIAADELPQVGEPPAEATGPGAR